MILIRIKRAQGLFIASAAGTRQAHAFGFGLSEAEAIRDLLAEMGRRRLEPQEADRVRRPSARA